MIEQRRIQKVNELLKREIGNILSRELDFPNILVTVTRIDTSSNLIQTKVYVSVLPEKEEEKIFNYLNQNIYFLQQILNKRMKIRPVPKIIFEKERETQKAGEIEEILESIEKKEKIE